MSIRDVVGALPIIPGLPGINPLFGPLGDAAGKVDDVLARDEKERLSAVLARQGWGSPKSDLNARAREVVRRESQGDEKARNPSGATGWFQIMTPLHCGKYGIPKGADECVKWLQIGENNAGAAKRMHRTSGWTPWISSGPIPPPPNPGFDPVVGTAKDSLTGSVADVAETVASPFTTVAAAAVELIGTLLSADTWFRIGKTWLGLVFVILGTAALVYVVANTASGGQVGKQAKTAALAVATKGKV